MIAELDDSVLPLKKRTVSISAPTGRLLLLAFRNLCEVRSAKPPVISTLITFEFKVVI